MSMQAAENMSRHPLIRTGHPVGDTWEVDQHSPPPPRHRTWRRILPERGPGRGRVADQQPLGRDVPEGPSLEELCHHICDRPEQRLILR